MNSWLRPLYSIFDSSLKILSGLLILGLQPGSYALAQNSSLEDIILNYEEAIGGKDAINAVKSLDIEGFSEMEGISIPLRIRVQSPRYLRLDYEFFGLEMTYLRRGDQAWRKDASSGGEFEALRVQYSQEMDWQSPLNYGAELFEELEEGEQLFRAPDATIDEQRYLRIDKIDENAQRSSFYFHPDNFMLMFRDDLQGRTIFEDYREVEGLWIPFYIENQNGKMSYSSIKLNPEFKPEVFAKPQ